MIINSDATAKDLGISKSALEKLRVYGGGPPFLKLGRSVRYSVNDLHTWLAERVSLSTSAYEAHTVLADFCTRSLGIGYPGGSLLGITSLGVRAIYDLPGPLRLLASAGPAFHGGNDTGFHAFLAVGIDY